MARPDLTDDGNTLLDLMTAAFTGDINEAMELLRQHGTGEHTVLGWDSRRLDDAHSELLRTGCLAPGAPPPSHGTATTRTGRLSTLLAITLALCGTDAVADAKPRAHKPQRQSQWMRDCIHERTGPDGGVSIAEARDICKAEQPDDEIGAARQALTLARLNAKVAKVQARIAKALEACEQAITDRCVETAKPDGSTDCDVDAGLRAEYELVCLGRKEGK